MNDTLQQTLDDISSGSRVIVKISAPGCGPCKVYARDFVNANLGSVIKRSLCISQEDAWAWFKTQSDSTTVPVTLLFADKVKIGERRGQLTLSTLESFAKSEAL